MSDIFAQLAMIESEAQAIIDSARDETEKTIKKLKEEAISEIDAIQKTTDLIEQQQNAENARKIDELRMESAKRTTIELDALRVMAQRNHGKAIEFGMQLIEKIK